MPRSPAFDQSNDSPAVRRQSKTTEEHEFIKQSRSELGRRFLTWPLMGYPS